MKKLYRSKNEKIFSGLFGGLSEYWNVDVSLLRLGFIAITVLTGFFPCIIGYIVAAIVVPVELAEEITKEEKEETRERSEE